MPNNSEFINLLLKHFNREGIMHMSVCMSGLCAVLNCALTYSCTCGIRCQVYSSITVHIFFQTESITEHATHYLGQAYPVSSQDSPFPCAQHCSNRPSTLQPACHVSTWHPNLNLYVVIESTYPLSPISTSAGLSF